MYCDYNRENVIYLITKTLCIVSYFLCIKYGRQYHPRKKQLGHLFRTNSGLPLTSINCTKKPLSELNMRVAQSRSQDLLSARSETETRPSNIRSVFLTLMQKGEGGGDVFPQHHPSLWLRFWSR